MVRSIGLTRGRSTPKRRDGCLDGKPSTDGSLDWHGLPCHHLPALRTLDPYIGIAAVQELGIAFDDHIHLHVARNDNSLSVDLDVLDWALKCPVLEDALFTQTNVLSTGIGLPARVGIDQIVAQQLVEGLEVAVDQRLIAAVFQVVDLGLDGVAHPRVSYTLRGVIELPLPYFTSSRTVEASVRCLVMRPREEAALGQRLTSAIPPGGH